MIESGQRKFVLDKTMATLELVLEKLQVLLEKNEQLEEKNERLQELIVEKTEMLEQRVSQLRGEVKYLSEKLNQQPQSPSSTATPTTTTATVARWTGGELTPNDRKAIRKKSEFSCYRRGLVKPDSSGTPSVVCDYNYERFCRFINEETGAYNTPVGGKYEFGLRATQYGAGLLKCFLVCTEMGWRHEILTIRKEKPNKEEEENTEKGNEENEKDNKGEDEEEEVLNASFESYEYYIDDNSNNVTLNGTVVMDCKEFVDVTIEIVLLRGFAALEGLCFSGKLIDFA